MLAARHKLTTSAQFSRTIKGGRRAGSKTLVVHVHHRKAEPNSPAIIPGPRFGLIVSKGIGNAVTRHRVSRLLRHQAKAVIDSKILAPETDIVVRALPASARANSAEISRDLNKALRKALKQ